MVEVLITITPSPLILVLNFFMTSSSSFTVIFLMHFYFFLPSSSYYYYLLYQHCLKHDSAQYSNIISPTHFCSFPFIFNVYIMSVLSSSRR